MFISRTKVSSFDASNLDEIWTLLQGNDSPCSYFTCKVTMQCGPRKKTWKLDLGLLHLYPSLATITWQPSTGKSAFVGTLEPRYRLWTLVEPKTKGSGFEKAGPHPCGWVANCGPSYGNGNSSMSLRLGCSPVWLGPLNSTTHQGSQKESHSSVLQETGT